MGPPTGSLPSMTQSPVVDAADRAVRTAEAAVDDRPSAEAVPPAETLPPRTAIVRGRRATAVGTLGVAGFAAIFALVKARRTDAFDLALMLKLQRRRNPLLGRTMAAASWFGFPPQSRIVPPALIAGLWLARLRVEAAFEAAAWGTALVSTLVKAAMHRPRPVADERLRVVTARLGGSSFPSGHVITYVGTYGFLAYLVHTLLRPVALRRAIVGGLLGLLALVGPSRVYEGHHWPTDVSASYLLGSAYVVGLTSLYRRVKARRVGTAA